MAEYKKHLYMVVFPINALVASQLAPDQFAEHYTIGSSKHFRGKVIFVEIDINFRDPYFKIDHYLELTVPHEDGSPKRTKFVKSHGVLEHIDFKALRDLYLVLPNGKCLPLKQQPYTAVNEPGLVRVYQGITPLTAMVASTLDQRSFAKYLTQSESKGAPAFCFTQYEFNVEEFLKQNVNREMMHSEDYFSLKTNRNILKRGIRNNQASTIRCFLLTLRQQEKFQWCSSLQKEQNGVNEFA